MCSVLKKNHWPWFSSAGDPVSSLNNNNSNNDNDRIDRLNSRFFYNLLTAPRTVSNKNARGEAQPQAQFEVFYNLLTAPRTVSNKNARGEARPYANHVQHIGRLSRATCRVPRGTKGQFSYQVCQS